MAMAYSSGFNSDKLKQSFYMSSNKMNNLVDAAMKEGAEEIMEESKLNCPVDTHNLETAHHITKRSTRRDNYAYDVEVSGEGEDGRDVDEYAAIMHDGTYNLGPKSQAKQDADPSHIVGRQYLERAVLEKKAEVIAGIKAAVGASL